jgi:ribosomal protein S18 acetylase RimI-like enzyme
MPGTRDGEALSAAMDVVRLRRLNRWQAEGLREDLADLYVESATAAPGGEYRNREAFLHRLAADVQRPGFDMLVAETAALAGFVEGYPLPRDGSWWQGLAGPMPHDLEQLTASGHLFAISEIAVHPHERDRDIAKNLQERLLADNEASVAATLVDAANHAAVEAFRAWGWQEIGEVRRPVGPPVLSLLILALGERSADRPDGLAHNDQTQRPE